MRASIAVLCTVLLLDGMPAAAERPAIRAGSHPIERERGGPSGLERAWPPRPLGVRLVQLDEDPSARVAGVDVEARIAELEARKAGIRRLWPTVGVVSGSVVTVAGITTLALVKATCRENDWFSDDPPETRCAGRSVDGKWAAGGLTVAAGLILVGVSGWKLGMRNRERRAIRREILELQRGRTARAAPSWNVAFEAGESRALHFSLRF